MSYDLLDRAKSQTVFKCTSFKKQLEVFMASLSSGDDLQIHHVLSSEKKAGSAFHKVSFVKDLPTASYFLSSKDLY